MITEQNNTNTFSKYLNYLHYAFISILAITALYLVYYSLDWKYTMDISPIRYVAKRILAGQLPYKDVFEFNMPFTYLVHIGILLISESDLAVRLADLMFQFLGMWGIFRIMQPINKKAALAAPLFFLCYNIMQGGPLAMLQRDLMIACLMPHIAYTFIYAHKANNYDFTISTILCFCAILIKPIILVLLLLLVIAMIFDQKITLEAKKEHITTVFITLLSGFLSFFILLTYLGITPYFIEILKFLKFFSSDNNSFMPNIIMVFKRFDPIPFFLDTYKLLKSLFLSNNNKYHFSTFILLLLKFILIPIVLALLTAVLYFFKQKKINWYIIVIFIYSIFHFYIQKKGFFYHLIPLKVVVFSLFCFVIFNENQNKKILYLYSTISILFICLFLRLVFYPIKLPINNEQAKIFEAIQTIKNYNFQTIQTLDMGLSGIEIVERLNRKNKYPLFYNFALNYDKSERVNEYKKAILEDVGKGTIDILLFSTQTHIMYSNQSVLIELEKAIKKNYIGINKIIYTGNTVIYQSKKLQKSNNNDKSMLTIF